VSLDLSPIILDIDLFAQGRCAIEPLSERLTEILGEALPRESTAELLVTELEADAELAFRVLTIVSSPYFSLPKPVRSIRYAVAYLGVVEVSRIFLTEVIRQEFSGAPATQAHGIWRHSYLVAVGARRLHQRFARSGDSRTLYAAALLHDLGKLVYLRFFPEHFGALDAYGAEHGVRFADAEEHLGLPPHRAFGALLCDHFRLPSDLKAACLNHDVEALERLVGHGERLWPNLDHRAPERENRRDQPNSEVSKLRARLASGFAACCQFLPPGESRGRRRRQAGVGRGPKTGLWLDADVDDRYRRQ
jgi:HD-like signal output (HDOD) protein